MRLRLALLPMRWWRAAKCSNFVKVAAQPEAARHTPSAQRQTAEDDNGRQPARARIYARLRTRLPVQLQTQVRVDNGASDTLGA